MSLNIDKHTKRISEGAVVVAISFALSFLKIPVGMSFGGFGGSIDFVMLPLMIFAFRNGALWGMGVGFCFGCLKYFLAGGTAISLVSLLLDYAIAYSFVGLSGIINIKNTKGNYKLFPLASIIGSFCRFFIHFLSGITVYASYMPDNFLGKTMTSASIYSLLYNGTYMLPNTIIAFISAILLSPILKKIKD